MKYTPEQQAAISTQGKLIVSASAGSGKTFVMINRLVNLVLGGVSVKNVLVLTFTNKAAAQMRDKLRRALIEKIKESDGKTRERLKNELSDLSLADIGTIHAFCARLVRTRFYLTDADPAFRIISADDAEGRALSGRALGEVFEEAYEKGGEEFSELLSVYFRKKKDARLKDAVVGLYKNVRTLGAEGDATDSREILSRVGEEDFFREACGIILKDFAERARLLCERVGALRQFVAEKKGALAVAESVAFYADRVMRATDLFGLAAEAGTAPAIGRMPPMTKSEGDELKALKNLSACAKEIKEIYKDLAGFASREDEYARCEDARRRACALKTLALRYGEEYARLKREAGVLDYDDLESYALTVLENKDARTELQQKYNYLFVDEYQDVNPMQEAILSALSGENVFLVGDSKQAIYGFRGSSSSHFEKKEEVFSAGDGHSLRLSSNFRSAPEILTAVNQVFEPLIDGYAPMVSGGAYPEGSGAVRLHYLEEEEEEEVGRRGVYSVLSRAGVEEKDALAEGVAKLIETELGKKWYDVEAVNPVTGEKGGYKEIGYGDIAVLARNNVGDMERIVRALSRRGIPFVTSSKINVCETFEAQLVLDWLNYLDNGLQDVPFVSALLSAVGGFTEAELTKIRLRFPSPNTFYGAAEEYRTKMADGLARKLEAFARKVSSLKTAAQVLSAAELMDRLLSMGLEAQIAAKEGGMSRLARVRRLAQEAGDYGLHEFLTRLKAGGNRVEYAENGGEGAVQVLTMHASKGLEFPVVILASQDALFHGAERDELSYTKRFLAAPRSFDVENKLVYETLVRRAAGILQKREELKQQKNLLYVAMTRARCRLHILLKQGERSLSSAYANRFSDLYDLSAYATRFEENEPTVSEETARENLLDGEETEPAVKLLEYRYPYATDYPVKSSATALLHSAPPVFVEEPAVREKEYADLGHSVEEGLAYHAFLEHVQFGAPAKEELSRMERAGLLSPDEIGLLDPIRLEKILALPALAGLAGKRVWRERTFLVRLPSREFFGSRNSGGGDETVFQGAIDLLAETEEGYLILDYKLSGRSDEGLREHYAPQIKLYKKAVARILKVDEDKVRACILNIARCREIQM